MSTIQTGQIIAEKYRVDGVLGHGGMGEVLRATQLGLGRAVAIKVLRRINADDEVQRKKFVREARVMAAFRHPGAVEVYDFGDHDGSLYIVMEMLLGDDLTHHILHEGRPPLTKSLEIVLSVSETLHAAHSLGIVHRDVKPDNIFLDGDALTPRLVDFGLAFIDDLGDLGRVTVDGIVSGTPHYMAPEQVAGKKVGPGADMYALGVVLFEMLTGRLPFRGNAAELFAAHLYQPPPLVSKINPDTPKRLVDLTNRMLDKDPKTRLPTTEVIEECRSILSGDVQQERARWAKNRKPGEARIPNRQQRMIPKPEPRGRGNPFATKKERTIAVIGMESDELERALSTSSIYIVPIEQQPDALFMPGATVKSLQDKLEGGYKVIATLDPLDQERTMELLKLPLWDIIPTPFTSETVATKFARAFERESDD